MLRAFVVGRKTKAPRYCSSPLPGETVLKARQEEQYWHAQYRKQNRNEN